MEWWLIVIIAVIVGFILGVFSILFFIEIADSNNPNTPF